MTFHYKRATLLDQIEHGLCFTLSMQVSVKAYFNVTHPGILVDDQIYGEVSGLGRQPPPSVQSRPHRKSGLRQPPGPYHPEAGRPPAGQ